MIGRLWNVIAIATIVFLTGVVVYQQIMIDKQSSTIRTCVAILIVNGILEGEDVDRLTEPQEVRPKDEGFSL